MTPAEIFFVAPPASVLDVARQAAQRAFPGGRITVVDGLEAALQSKPAGGSQLLVLASADDAAAASQILGPNGLPRWAIVVLGGDLASAELTETVPAGEWNLPLLTRVFRSTVLQHELLGENLRLRGDLKTVARRISHDLRTPLGCIHTTSDMLPDLDAASLAAMGGVIRQSSHEISQIIDRTSFVLKATADPLPAAPVEMGLLVDVVLRQLEPVIKETRAAVQQPATWPEATGVAPWLQVIWWNLLQNALRHGGAGAKVRLGWERTGGSYRFFVADGGVGVAPERQAGLFLPFEQLHAARTTGLGLSVVHRLISLQGGRCHYEKSPENGTCFSFTLPAAG